MAGAVVAVAWALPGKAFAQLTPADIATLRARGEAEGWTFTVGESGATHRPMHELCGLVEPVGWRATAAFDSRPVQRDLPPSYDWRDFGACTPIRDQASCGSCWAFAGIGVVESMLLINASLSTDLSEQWLVSCTDAGNCEAGGFTSLAFDYLKLGGLQDPCGDSGAVLEADFPYQAADIPCDCPYAHPHSIFSWAVVGPRMGTPTVGQIKQAILDYGPVSTGIHVSDAFRAYDDGVFNADESGVINHAVVLVGWDDALGTEGVWILRNSWNTDWGVDGYMFIEYGCSEVGFDTLYVNYSPQDCNGNSIPDRCDISCETVGSPCQVPGCGTALDCNENLLPDECDITSGRSTDYNSNGVPDECEPDCNDNGLPDDCDISCSGGCAGAPGCGQISDCDDSGVPDDCKIDCQPNGVPDVCDIIDQTSEDCQPDGVPDDCQVEEYVTVEHGSCTLSANNGEPWCDDFESYPLGSIHGLNGWIGFGNNPIQAATVTTAENHTSDGSQSLEIGEADVEKDTLRPLTGYDQSVSAAWTVRVWMLVPSSTTSYCYVIINSAYSGFIQGTRPGARVHAAPDEGYLYTDITGARLPLIVDQWVEVRFDINLAQDLVAVYYDDVLLDTHAWTLTGGPLEIAAVHALAFGGPEPFYVDDISVYPSSWYSRDCNGNLIPDDCDIDTGVSLDANANGIPDECESTAPGPEPGGPPCSVPGDCAGAYEGADCVGEFCYIPKNRYLTIDPTANLTPVAYQVEILEAADSPSAIGRNWWVDAPVCYDYPNGEPVTPAPATCEGADRFGWVSGLVSTPVTRAWTEQPLHITSCGIVPVVTYEIRGSADDGGSLSATALLINTAHRPEGDAQSWGDVTGGPAPGMPGLWLPPERATNFADIGNAIRTFENRSEDTGFPPRVWVDVEINQVINMADVSFLIAAFETRAYADINLPLIGIDPADCP